MTQDMTRKKKAGGKLEAEVKGAEPKALLRLVLDLCDLTDENRMFVQARLRAVGDPLTPYKERIDRALYPDVYEGESIRISAARRAITQYRKAAGDVAGMLELMIYYVERGTAFTADFGDIDEGFYNSLESMYDRFLKMLEKSDPMTKESFRDRAAAVVERAEGIGWGYYDYVADRFAESFH